MVRSDDGGKTFRQTAEFHSGNTYVVASDSWGSDATLAMFRGTTMRREYGDANLFWSTGGQFNQIANSTGYWVSVAVFRGTHATNPVVVAMMLNKQKQHEIWKTNSNMVLGKLQQSPIISTTGFSQNSFYLEPVAFEVNERTMFASFKLGGARKGKIGDDFTLTGEQESPLVLSDGRPYVINQAGPYKSDVGSNGQLVVGSPNFLNDGTMFAGGYYSVYASMDKGLSWHEVWSLPQTVKESDCEDNCLLCDYTNTRLCLECASGFQREKSEGYFVDTEGRNVANFHCI